MRLRTHRPYSVTSRKVIEIVPQRSPIFLCLRTIIAPTEDLIGPSPIAHHLPHLRTVLNLRGRVLLVLPVFNWQSCL